MGRMSVIAQGQESLDRPNLNAFVYAQDNPVSYLDANGYYWCAWLFWVFGVGGIVVGLLAASEAACSLLRLYGDPRYFELAIHCLLGWSWGGGLAAEVAPWIWV